MRNISNYLVAADLSIATAVSSRLSRKHQIIVIYLSILGFP